MKNKERIEFLENLYLTCHKDEKVKLSIRQEIKRLKEVK